jgi:hypothetical protein
MLFWRLIGIFIEFLKEKRNELHRREQIMEFQLLERIRKLEHEKQILSSCTEAQDKTIETISADAKVASDMI